MEKYLFKIHPNDNVNICMSGEKKGHKFAARFINKGEDIIKYGVPIARATSEINVGEHVHTHNTETRLEGRNDFVYKPEFTKVETKLPRRNFQGYLRKDGRVGIRNELWIIPTVGCVNGIARLIIKAFEKEHPDEKVQLFEHQYGCSQLGDDHERTKRVLQVMANHPNAGGVLVIGLGCENNQLDTFKEMDYDPERLRFLLLQEVEDEIELGLKLLEELLLRKNKDKRESCPISDLVIGLECGGSDGLSGITANPLLGWFSDYIVSYGGSTILTEVPEMFGAEEVLIKRCKDEKVFNDFVTMIDWFKDYYLGEGYLISKNPSPGNKSGGITTLEDKSMGCVQKAGSEKIVDILPYGDTTKIKGVNLLYSPGNDAVATTALGLAGCQIVLFTTGRGTPFGGFIPTMKISTNTELAKKKKNWIDFDAGVLLAGKDKEELLSEFSDAVFDIINGKECKNEENDFRQIAIFKTGITL